MTRYITILALTLLAALARADTNHYHIRYIPAGELAETVIESNVLVSVIGDRNNLRIGDGVTTGGVRIMRTDALTSMPYTVGHDLSLENYDLWLDDEYALAADNNGSAHLWRGSTNIWTVIATTSSVAVVDSETDGTNVIISLSAVALLAEPDIYYSAELSPPDWQTVTNAVYVWPPTGSVWTISCPIPEEDTNGYFVVRYSDASIGITFGVPVHVAEFWLASTAITNISTNAAASGVGELMTASAIAEALLSAGGGSGVVTNILSGDTNWIAVTDGDTAQPTVGPTAYMTSSVAQGVEAHGWGDHGEAGYGTGDVSSAMWAGDTNQYTAGDGSIQDWPSSAGGSDTSSLAQVMSIGAVAGAPMDMGYYPLTNASYMRSHGDVLAGTSGVASVTTIMGVAYPSANDPNFFGASFLEARRVSSDVGWGALRLVAGLSTSTLMKTSADLTLDSALTIEDAANSNRLVIRGGGPNYQIEIGDLANANYQDDAGIAIGYNANGRRSGAVAIGDNTYGYNGSVAIGSSASAGTAGANVGIGSSANGGNYGVAVGSSANGWTFGAAVGLSANGYDRGSVVGYLANASTYGAAVGNEANGVNYGVAVGYQANAQPYGISIGYKANGKTTGLGVGYAANGDVRGCALGVYANGRNTNIAIGAYAYADGSERISIGHDVTNSVDNSARIRGDLYLDGATGIYFRATFGSGDWDSIVIDRANTQIIYTVNSITWTNSP